MPVAALDRPRVRLDKTETLNRQSQQTGGDLPKAGLVALTVRLGAEHQCDAAVRLEADLGALARRAARGLEKTGDAEPAQLAAVRCGPAPSRKALGQDPLRHLVEIGGKPSAIDRDPETAAIREATDKVPPTQRARVECQPARGAIAEPLDQVVGFGLAGAAIGVDRH